MADVKTNRIQIRHGSSVPTGDNLLNYELGIADATNLLYFKDGSGEIQTVGDDPDALTDDEINEILGTSFSPELVIASSSGSHNSIYRGQALGSKVTAAQWEAIEAGTFEDLYIGDYWTIGDINYRIAAFDYYYRTGDTSCATHHIVIVPDTIMYTHIMNDTDVTTGAYVGSKMYTEGLDSAKTTINNAFGSDHILSHRQFLQNAITGGYASAGSWYDSTVELMTEQNVYGCRIFGNCENGTSLPNLYTVDNSQYPLFIYRPDMKSNRTAFWLRDVGTATSFCFINEYGNANCYGAASSKGVRPSFSIC